MNSSTKPAVTFVILHYLTWDVTQNCINSILSLDSSSAEVTIIVVDNASSNNSLDTLKEAFSDTDNIVFIKSDENLGFAKGNNLGYDYAVGTLHSDFVVFANNDTLFEQTDFISAMLKTYKDHKCALLGPDILNIMGFHQNPYRPHIISLPEVKRWIRNRRLWLCFLKADKIFHLSKHFSFFYSFYVKRSNAGKPNDTWNIPTSDVVLHGACIITTPEFVRHFTEYAFYPDTFMYCEEDILTYLVHKKGLSTYYNPNMQIKHMESSSTNKSFNSNLSKELFLTENILKSLKILLRIIKESE